jgi:hypothetical protein
MWCIASQEFHCCILVILCSPHLVEHCINSGGAWVNADRRRKFTREEQIRRWWLRLLTKWSDLPSSARTVRLCLMGWEGPCEKKARLLSAYIASSLRSKLLSKATHYTPIAFHSAHASSIDAIPSRFQSSLQHRCLPAIPERAHVSIHAHPHVRLPLRNFFCHPCRCSSVAVCAIVTLQTNELAHQKMDLCRSSDRNTATHN